MTTHLKGVLAVIDARPSGWHLSELLCKLLAEIRNNVASPSKRVSQKRGLTTCQFALYILGSRNEYLEDLNRSLHISCSNMSAGIEPTGPFLGALRQMGRPRIEIRIPELRSREKVLLQGLENGNFNAVDARKFLEDAKEEEVSLDKWISEYDQGFPPTVQTLLDSTQIGKVNRHPKVIRIHHKICQATLRTYWRATHIVVLGMIHKIAKAAALGLPHQQALPFIRDQRYAEGNLQFCVDEICSSVPGFMFFANTDAMLKHYPHEPGAAPLPSEPTPELMAGLSQIRWPVMVASQVETVPRAQRQWLQQYLTLLSSDPIADWDRAMRLELV